MQLQLRVGKFNKLLAKCAALATQILTSNVILC